MSDANIEKWKQIGNLYLWYYTEGTRNYPGWHLTADSECCNALADLFDKMLSAQWNSQKLLTITTPSERVLKVPNNRGGTAGWKSVNTLRLKHSKDLDEHYSELIEIDREVVLTVSNQKLQQIGKCISQIPKYVNDYSIEVGTTQLWFW